jgi:hypothetical protein
VNGQCARPPCSLCCCYLRLLLSRMELSAAAREIQALFQRLYNGELSKGHSSSRGGGGAGVGHMHALTVDRRVAQWKFVAGLVVAALSVRYEEFLHHLSSPCTCKPRSLFAHLGHGRSLRVSIVALAVCEQVSPHLHFSSINSDPCPLAVRNPSYRFGPAARGAQGRWSERQWQRRKDLPRSMRTHVAQGGYQACMLIRGTSNGGRRCLLGRVRCCLLPHLAVHVLQAETL